MFLSMRQICAFDVDLLRVHGYSAQTGRICYNASEWPWAELYDHAKILIEIASPVDTSKSSAEAYNRRKWAIGNSLMIGRLMYRAETEGWVDRVLVSPADKWTMKYTETERDMISGCMGQDNHDIRACRAMLFFHSTNPEHWRPLREYYASLSTKKASK